MSACATCGKVLNPTEARFVLLDPRTVWNDGRPQVDYVTVERCGSCGVPPPRDADGDVDTTERCVREPSPSDLEAQRRMLDDT